MRPTVPSSLSGQLLDLSPQGDLGISSLSCSQEPRSGLDFRNAEAAYQEEAFRLSRRLRMEPGLSGYSSRWEAGLRWIFEWVAGDAGGAESQVRAAGALREVAGH